MCVVGVVLWFVASLRVASDCSSAPQSRWQFRSCAPLPWASLSSQEDRRKNDRHNFSESSGGWHFNYSAFPCRSCSSICSASEESAVSLVETWGNPQCSTYLFSFTAVLGWFLTFQPEVRRVLEVPSSLASLIPAISTLLNPIPSSPIADAATPSEAALISNVDQLISSLAQLIPFFTPSPPWSANFPIFVPAWTPDKILPLLNVEDLLDNASPKCCFPKVILHKSFACIHSDLRLMLSTQVFSQARRRPRHLLLLESNRQFVEGFIESLVDQHEVRSTLLVFLLELRMSTFLLLLLRKPKSLLPLIQREPLAGNLLANRRRTALLPRSCQHFLLSQRPSLCWNRCLRDLTPVPCQLLMMRTFPTMRSLSPSFTLLGYSFRRDILMRYSISPSTALTSVSTSKWLRIS